ncbi:hypothetical protein RUM44_002135 [Polyplax serrata]|uniref:Uncharacterized protein n=1 Tax=Polyplax serrata TaxID=468196 RepID=A0ABR1AMD3_POLSC
MVLLKPVQTHAMDKLLEDPEGEISSGQSDSSCSPPLTESAHPNTDMNITAMSVGSVKNDPNSSPGQELYSSPGPTSLSDTWTASVECNGE